MTSPALDERKTFWRWTYAHDCFGNVIEICDELLGANCRPPAKLRRHLLCALVVTYAKPFTRWIGLDPFPSNVIPREAQDLHEKLMDLRNKHFAHLDAVKFLADDPAYGNINRITITFTKGEYTVGALRVEFPDERVHEVRALARTMFEKADYHISKFCRKFLETDPIPDGRYRINLDPSDPRAFIPVSPAQTSGN